MDDQAAEVSGGLRGDSLDIDALCGAHQWSRTRLIHELRKAARVDGQQLPADDSLKRMIRLWANGTRQPSDMYADLLRRALGVAAPATGEGTDDFLDLVDRGDSCVDAALILALEAQTESLRQLDRRLGAHRLLTQAEAHARTVADLVQWAPLGRLRAGLAACGAEAMALAGWQALDQGQPKRSWHLHQEARTLAYESGDVGVTAHVTAQQAYALLDAGRLDRALSQFQAARSMASTQVPEVVTAWLAAAEAEARASVGDRSGALSLLDEADRRLGTGTVPYVVLNSNHLARWRGHCLARLGDQEAVTTLSAALTEIDPHFTRARGGLHADLATAHSVQGDAEPALHHARLARQLSATTGSARQRARLIRLLNSERE